MLQRPGNHLKQTSGPTSLPGASPGASWAQARTWSLKGPCLLHLPTCHTVIAGAGIVAAVRWVSHESLLFTFVAAIPVALWWWLFLLVMPQQFKEAVLQQDNSMQ